MKNAIWLRIAAGLNLLLATGHTLGAVLAAPSHGAEEVALRDAMRGFRVVEMGIERSYWDFYFGSGLTITVLLLATTVTIWLLAPLAQQASREVRLIVIVLAVAYAGVTAVSLLYFVTAPIVVSAAITASLVFAALGDRA